MPVRLQLGGRESGNPVELNRPNAQTSLGSKNLAAHRSSFVFSDGIINEPWAPSCTFPPPPSATSAAFFLVTGQNRSVNLPETSAELLSSPLDLLAFYREMQCLLWIAMNTPFFNRFYLWCSFPLRSMLTPKALAEVFSALFHLCMLAIVHSLYSDLKGRLLIYLQIKS